MIIGNIKMNGLYKYFFFILFYAFLSNKVIANAE